MPKTKPAFVNNREAFCLFAKALGVRHDWHEPDEQGVTVAFGGLNFDNAMRNQTEKHIIIKVNGKSVAWVNLADLCAWASAQAGAQ